MITLTVAITLTIPDNEAFTAAEALSRMGLPVERLERADIWRFEVDPAQAAALQRELPTIETIFNPNKHRLDVRANDTPVPGEVWIAPRDESAATTVAGRALPGVTAIRRATAWRLGVAAGEVAPGLLDRAVAEFLCNPAFQKVLP